MRDSFLPQLLQMVVEQGLPVRIGLLLVSEEDLREADAEDEGEGERGTSGHFGGNGGGGGSSDEDSSRSPKVRRAWRGVVRLDTVDAARCRRQHRPVLYAADFAAGLARPRLDPVRGIFFCFFFLSS